MKFPDTTNQGNEGRVTSEAKFLVYRDADGTICKTEDIEDIAYEKMEMFNEVARKLDNRCRASIVELEELVELPGMIGDEEAA